jgi:hypothetical protein
MVEPGVIGYSRIDEPHHPTIQASINVPRAQRLQRLAVQADDRGLVAQFRGRVDVLRRRRAERGVGHCASCSEGEAPRPLWVMVVGVVWWWLEVGWGEWVIWLIDRVRPPKTTTMQRRSCCSLSPPFRQC